MGVVFILPLSPTKQTPEPNKHSPPFLECNERSDRRFFIFIIYIEVTQWPSNFTTLRRILILVGCWLSTGNSTRHLRASRWGALPFLFRRWIRRSPVQCRWLCTYSHHIHLFGDFQAIFLCNGVSHSFLINMLIYIKDNINWPKKDVFGYFRAEGLSDMTFEISRTPRWGEGEVSKDFRIFKVFLFSA